MVRIFLVCLASGFLVVHPSAMTEAGWLDLFWSRSEEPKGIEERAKEVGDVGILPGLLAPDFVLPKLGDGTAHLSSYRGKKGVVLNFWATWCFPCRKEMPSLETLNKTYAERGLLVLGINIDKDGQSSGDAALFIQETGVTFPIAFDSDGRTAEAYAVHGLPVTYLIKPDGYIFYRVFGERDWMSEKVRAQVEKLLPTPDPS